MTRVSAVVLVVIPLLGAHTARAQAHDESVLAGTVFDPSGAVVRDAAVSVSGPSLIGGPRSTTTDERGQFRIPLLTPGVYQVVASSPSFAATRRSGIAVPANATVTVDMRLEIGSVRSEVEVGASSPMLDVRSSSSPTAVDQSMLRHLPTDRVVADLLNLAPGVYKAAAPGAPDNVAFGGTQGSNGVLVDGINTTDSETGAVRLTPHYNWIDQAEVVAIGANAEYGRTTGATLDATIRSGSNRFAGLAEYRMTPSRWVAGNTPDPAFTPRSIRTSWDGDAQIGGPIQRDRLWFFSGFAYSDLVDRPAGLTGPDYTSTRYPEGVAKIDAAAGAALRLDGLFSAEHQSIHNQGLSVSLPAATVARRSVQTNRTGSGRVRWIGGSATTAEIQVDGYSSPGKFGSQLPNGNTGPAPHHDLTTGIASQNASAFGRSNRNAASIRASATHYADTFLGGSHELKFGADIERTKTRDALGYPTGRNYYDYGGAPYIVALYDGSDVRASATETSLFAQDDWQIHGVTLNAGIRVDLNRGSVPGGGTVFSTTPVSPRIGVAWDVSRNHRTVVKAHYGSYADPIYTNLFRFKDAAGQSPTIIANVVGPGIFEPIDREDPYTAMIDPEIAPPHVVQAYIGIDRELAADAAIEARYINRRFKDFIGNVDTGSVWDPVSRIDPGPDNVIGTADDGGALTLFKLANSAQKALVVTNPGPARRRYDAVQVIARKRYSRDWQALVGYTWARTSGTVASGGTFANAFLDRWDFAWYGPFVDPNRLVNKDETFRSTELKVLATYHLSRLGGTNVSAVLRAVSGAPVRRTALFRGLAAGAETVIADPSVSTYLDPTRTIDLRVEKTVQARGRTLGFYVDVLNATNQGVATSIVAQSGSRFGTPLTWSDPRSARLAVRWIF